MVVDDSAVIRGMISRILETSPNIEVTSTAQNGEVAVRNYELNPVDVVILDIEMPVMDGITALGHIMKHDPKAKIIMCSTLTHANAEITLRAMALGAADYIAKPTTASEVNNSEGFKEKLLHLVHNFKPTQHNYARPLTPSALKSSPQPATAATASTTEPRSTLTKNISSAPPILRPEPLAAWRPRILAISASTGGPQALFSFFKALSSPPRIPIVLTQHMPATFTALLAKHITLHTGIPAFEAENDMPLEAGRIYVAKGGLHMLIEKGTGGLNKLKLDNSPPENFCKPAADPMLRSLIPLYSGQILSVVLTGMGADGTKGCEDIVKAGGHVIAQDQASSVVWGMPGSVATQGLCCKIDTPQNLGLWTRQKVI